jgi:hypothetical protein
VVNAVLAAGEENAAYTVRNENREDCGEAGYTVNRVRIVEGTDSLLLGAVDTVLKLEGVAELRNRQPEERVWGFLRQRMRRLVDGLFPG